MLEYRTFRNTDTPRLVSVWNEAFPNRGSPRLVNNTLLERYVLSKPIFDPQGLFVAESNGGVVGWAHAGDVGQSVQHATGRRHLPDRRAPRPSPPRDRQRIAQTLREITCAAKGPTSCKRAGIGRTIRFYMGLYGGCDSPGFLVSDSLAEPFFVKKGYRVQQKDRGPAAQARSRR